MLAPPAARLNAPPPEEDIEGVHTILERVEADALAGYSSDEEGLADFFKRS